jgi:hypothetical protein
VSRAVRQVASLVAVAVLAVAGAGCSAQTGQVRGAGTGHQTRAAASRSPQGASAELAPRLPSGAACPVTVPVDAAAVPPVVARAGGDWYGRDDLWVALWFARPDPANFARHDGFYGLKYGSVTLDGGKLTSRFGPPAVRARRLDGPGIAKVGFGGYGNTGSLQFWPTGIDFSEPGCWLVTSSLRKTIVRFVVEVL